MGSMDKRLKEELEGKHMYKNTIHINSENIKDYLKEIDDVEKDDLESDRFNDLKDEDRKDVYGYEDD